MPYSGYYRVILVLFVMLISTICQAITTKNPYVGSQNNNCTIESVSVTELNTIVAIRVPNTYRGVSISNVTVLVPEGAWPITSARMSNIDISDFHFGGSDRTLNLLLVQKARELLDAKQDVSENGWLIRSLGYHEFDTNYHAANGSSSFLFKLYFDALPPGIERFYIRELKKDGKEWVDIHINNPRDRSFLTSYDSQSIKAIIDSCNDGISGIYEEVSSGGNRYTLGCIKDGGQYKILYLDSSNKQPSWKVGEVKCILYPSATSGVFRGDWYMAAKKKNTNCFVSFDGSTMSVLLDGEKTSYIKMYPSGTNNSRKGDTWSGSGFALNDGYIVTNYHVVEGAKQIIVRGGEGKLLRDYEARVIATDKTNDLAIIQISDSNFHGFGTIPYTIKSQMVDVGEKVWTLGYPLTQVLGSEIKLTDGIISSRSGYHGDVSTYQISVAVQPGNSGGPLFDPKGDIVGVVNAGISGAENVGYAIKASYLKNLLESYSLSGSIPTNNTLAPLSLKDQVKRVKRFVYLLLCSSTNSIERPSQISREEKEPKEIPVERIELSRSKLTIASGAEESLRAILYPSNATNTTITWVSSNPAVATVDAGGFVKALSNGTTTITATVNGKSADCVVTVRTPISNVSLNKSSLTLTKGQGKYLRATVAPENAVYDKIEWRSSNPSIATVDAGGFIKALSNGTTTITATVNGMSANCVVTVTTPVSLIILDMSSLTLVKGQSKYMKATVAPEDAVYDRIEWSSSNPSVATVDASGFITALRNGTTTITAAVNGKSTNCVVTVTTPVSLIMLDRSSLTITKGQLKYIKSTVLPEDSIYDRIEWSSSNPSVATVDKWGCVKALSNGTTTITAAVNGVSANCVVTVTTPVSLIILDMSSLTLVKGQSKYMKATVAPEDAVYDRIEWSSRNPLVATVDSSGFITALSNGTTTITAAVNGKSTNCVVTVTTPVSLIMLDRSSLTLTKGQLKYIKPTVLPEDSIYDRIEWSSSNPSVATVDKWGCVKALSNGTTAITARVGDASARCSVVVSNAAYSISLSKTSIEMKKGGYASLYARVIPSDANQKEIRWFSSDESVVTVDEGGTLSAKGCGTAIVTVSAGTISETCLVTVIPPHPPVSAISINTRSSLLRVGGSARLFASVTPQEASGSVVWESSDPSVVSVDATGTIKALKKGKVTISASVEDKVATCSVIAKVYVSSIRLSKSSLSLSEGKGAFLVAQVFPFDAEDKTVQWTSSNEKVATVNERGFISAQRKGKAIITARAGDVTATCTVVVK